MAVQALTRSVILAHARQGLSTASAGAAPAALRHQAQHALKTSWPRLAAPLQQRSAGRLGWTPVRAMSGLVVLLFALLVVGASDAEFCSAATQQCGINLVEQIKEKNEANSVIVYSKSYCPYSTQVKSLFEELAVPAKIIELDEIADGADVQSALADVTGRSTVPQVFIGGKFIGGCDDTLAAHKSNKLAEELAGVGITIES